MKVWGMWTIKVEQILEIIRNLFWPTLASESHIHTHTHTDTHTHMHTQVHTGVHRCTKARIFVIIIYAVATCLVSICEGRDIFLTMYFNEQ